MKRSLISNKAILFYLIALLFFIAGCVEHADESSPLAPSTKNNSDQLSYVQTNGFDFTGRYIILGQGTNLPNNLEAAIKLAGGNLVTVIPEIGVAIAEGTAPKFAERAAKIRGVESVSPDVIIQWIDPILTRDDPELVADSFDLNSEAIGDNAFFGDFQWAPNAVGAPKAWAAGYTGAGVRVAILDGAVYNSHLDLAPNVDVAASTSFVPGFQYNQDTGTFWHGTHVAGIVAATGNIGTVGIAPNATLIGVKVLHSGSGSFESILQGIVYAAKPIAQGGAGAHIINMSLGATIDYRNNWSDKEFRDAFRELAKAVDRATRYATQRGVTVIASAGNDGTNFDLAKELFKIPAQNQNVISVSATGPHGWALGATDFERPAYYTDHGKSLVDLAAPGGTIGLWLIDGVDEVCTVTGSFISITNFCEIFDLIISTSRGSGGSVTSYSWAQGTSMAAPLVAGVAALIIEKNGGEMNPLAVGAILQRSATDYGKPGNDEWYGLGWINAAKAVGVEN
jgi:lantibiotic leader peptide-processing serine protease